MKSWYSLFICFLIHLMLFAENIPTPFPLPLAITPVQNKSQAFKGNGQEHVAYELVVSNFSRFPLRIVSLKIKGKKIGNCLISKNCRCCSDGNFNDHLLLNEKIKQKELNFFDLMELDQYI